MFSTVFSCVPSINNPSASFLFTAAHMRRASAELAERRRASLGASRGLRPDGTLDPYHAAILFRDSRGVSTTFFSLSNDVTLAHRVQARCMLLV